SGTSAGVRSGGPRAPVWVRYLRTDHRGGIREQGAPPFETAGRRGRHHDGRESRRAALSVPQTFLRVKDQRTFGNPYRSSANFRGATVNVQRYAGKLVRRIRCTSRRRARNEPSSRKTWAKAGP